MLTSYTLQFPRYSQDKILKVKVTTAMAKVKSRPQHDVAHQQTPTNVPIRYQLPTSYSFQEMARTRFYRWRSLWQGQIKVTPWCAHLHPLNKAPTKYQLLTPYSFWDTALTNFFPLPVQTPAHLDTMAENNTLTVLKGCGVKTKEIIVLLMKGK